MSPDGTRLVAAAHGSRLAISQDSGQSWTLRGPAEDWISVAISVDGSGILAAPHWSPPGGVGAGRFDLHLRGRGGDLGAAGQCAGLAGHRLIGGGATWMARATNGFWRAVASSADGNRLIAVAPGGRIQTYPLAAAGGVILRRGMPALLPIAGENPPRFSALFGRRKNSELDYQVQFASDFSDWENSLAPPLPAGEDELVEAFSGPFPAHLSNGRVPHFFRIRIIGF